MGTVLFAMTGALSSSVNAGEEISANRTIFAVAHLSTGSLLNIRTKPKTTAPVIARLRKGDRVPLDANACFNAVTGKPTSKPRSSPNVWCEVIIEGDIIAYARAKYFEPIN